MKLPKKTKWPSGGPGAGGEGTGPHEGCLLQEERERTPGKWTGGGADIPGVIYHRSRDWDQLETLLGWGTGPAPFRNAK